MSVNIAMQLARSTPGVGVLGAIVGGSVTLAKHLPALKDGSADNRAVAIETGREAAGAGVATAVATYAAGVIGGGLLVSVGTAVAVAAVGKLAFDRGVDYIAEKV